MCLPDAHVGEHCCCWQQKCSLSGVYPDLRTQRPHWKHFLALSMTSDNIYYSLLHYIFAAVHILLSSLKEI